MASERENAKDAVVSSEENDPELDNALANAAKHQLDLKREDNRHKEKMNAQNLGFIGNLFGDGKSLPTTAALITIGMAFLVAIGLYIAAYHSAGDAELWTANAERSLAVAAAALAYVFGKGAK